MDFRRFWLADAVSQLGTRMTFLAAPLVAVLYLHASAFETALVRAAQTSGALLFGLLAGAWVDRVRCRPVLIGTDLGRFVLLLAVPAAALAGVLELWLLYAVMFGVGVLTVLFDVAHQTYLPRLVPAASLVSANARLAGNTSVAAVAGSSLGGYLVQVLTAPFVFVIDALSMLWSALWVRAISHREPPVPRAPDRHLGREIAEGVRFVARQPLLRAIAGTTATTVLWQSAGMAVVVVFLVRDVGLSAGMIGLLSTVGLLGALAAALLSSRMSGMRALLYGTVALGPAMLAQAFTTPGWGLLWYVASTAGSSFCIVLTNVVQMTCRPRVCPPALLGRVGATMEFMVWGLVPVGALLGGVLATVAGTRWTLAISGAGVCLAALWLLFSPVRTMRDLPAAATLGSGQPHGRVPQRRDST